MKSDLEKSKNELVQELHVLRQRAAEADDLQNRLEEIEKSYRDLHTRFEERTKELERECFDRDQTKEALRMAEVIIDNSPAILFRRVAGEDPRLVYVSENIRQMGYTAEEFFMGDLLSLVKNGKIWIIDDFPTLFSDSDTVINILRRIKNALVEIANLFQKFSPEKPAGGYSAIHFGDLLKRKIPINIRILS